MASPASTRPAPSPTASTPSSSHSRRRSPTPPHQHAAKPAAARRFPTTLPQAQPRKQTQFLLQQQAVGEQQGAWEEEHKQPAPILPSLADTNRGAPRAAPPAGSHPASTSARSSPTASALHGRSSVGAAVQVGAPITTPMAYVPRPDALTHGVEYTKAERDGLPAVAYALCEFIDNALLALRKSKEREPSLQPEIKILFVEPTGEWAQAKKMCILISDNGCGMNASTLESFARLADAPKNRGIVRDTNQEADDRYNNYVNCSISQFGVGAKSAGFYLGTSIKVMSCPGNGVVYEINMSKAEMQRKDEETSNPFETDRRERAQKDLDNCLFVDEAMNTHAQIRRVMQEELKAECRHFSRFLITTDAPSKFLRDSVRGSQRDGREIAWHLADVYYRLLHGPYGHDNTPLNSKAAWMCPKISLEFHSQDVQRWSIPDLRKIDVNPQSLYMTQRSDGGIFRCEVEFTPPSSETEAPVSGLAIARVEVMYYRKLWERETHPDLVRAAGLEELVEDGQEATKAQREEEMKSGRHRRGARGALLQADEQKQQQQQQQEDEPSPQDKEALREAKKLRDGEKLGSFFWNGRLIPDPKGANKLLWFMEHTQSPELKEALTRVHYNIFFCYPVLTDRVKLTFQQNLIEYINREPEPQHGWIRNEYVVDSNGQSKECPRSKAGKLRELFKKQLMDWMQYDEHYRFSSAHLMRDFDEEHAYFSQVQLGENKFVRQGDLVLIQSKAKGKAEQTFIRVLCVRQEITKQEYLDRVEFEIASQGSVVGYLEPREREDGPPANANKVEFAPSSVQALLSAAVVKRQPAHDLKLAPFRLRRFPLRQIDKEITDKNRTEKYKEARQKAAKTYPTRMAVYVVPSERVWEEVKDGEERQARVADVFPGSSIALLTDNVDEAGLPVPVAGEKVMQSIFLLTDERSTRARMVEAQLAQNESRRRGGRGSNPRAGQLAPRRRIPRVVREEEPPQEEQKEEPQGEPELRVSSSGRVIKPTQDRMQVDEPSNKRKLRDGSAQRGKKRRVGEGRQGRGSNDDNMEVEEEEVEEERRQVVPRREEVEDGRYTGEVMSVQDATSLLHRTLVRHDGRVKGFKEKRFKAVGMHQIEYKLLAKVVEGDRDHVPLVTINVRVFPGAPVSIAAEHAAQPLSMRLGKRSTEGLRLVLKDSSGIAITPRAMEGWKGADELTFRMWCSEYPQLQVTADSTTLQAHQQRDEYQVVGLKLTPSEEERKGTDEWMQDFDAVEGRVVTCCIEFAASSATPIVVTQKVRMLPGEPQRINDDNFPTEVDELVNNDPFPDFTLKYVNAFDKPAALTDDAAVPVVSMWCDDDKVVGWGPGEIAAQPMGDNGFFSSTSLQLPPIFVEPRVLANIMTTNRERKVNVSMPEKGIVSGEHSVVVHLEVSVGGESILHRSCLVWVRPRALPSFLIVDQVDQILEVEELHINSTLEFQAKPSAPVKLYIHGIDDGGYMQYLDDDPNLASSNQVDKGWRGSMPVAIRKAIKVTVDGLVDLIGGPYECGLNEVGVFGLLQHIKMPRHVEGRRLRCKVSVEFDEARLVDGAAECLTQDARSQFDALLYYARTRLPLTSDFIVNVLHGAPCKWSAVVPSHLRCNVLWDRKVQLFAVDQHGNKVSIPKRQPPPRVRVTFDLPVTETDESKMVDTVQPVTSVSLTASHSHSHADERKHSDDLDDESAYQQIQLEGAEPVGVEDDVEGADDDVKSDEWLHFELPNARVIMPSGAAVLTVFDEQDALQMSEAVHFTVQPGEPKSVRMWLKDSRTNELLRLRNPRPLQSSSTTLAERRMADGLQILPVRMKFEELVVAWLDRAKNVVVPSAQSRGSLVLMAENAALFQLQHGGALEKGQPHVFHLVALPELQGDNSVFPPFVCVYSKHADDLQRAAQRAEDMRDEESTSYQDKRLQLSVGVVMKDNKVRKLTKIEFGLCLLPFSVRCLKTEAVYKTDMAHLEQHRALLNPAVVSNLKMEELEENDVMVLAGVVAPDVHVKLPQEENKSSLQYTLPRPDPSSLSIQWVYRGQRCHLRYHDAEYDDATDSYIFRPLVDDGKESERMEDVEQGEEGVVAVGRSGKLNKTGEWSYCVTYTERRPRLADVMTDRERSQTVVEVILPGVPHALRAQCGDGTNATLPIISSGESGTQTLRDVRLFIVDEYGSAVHLSLMSKELKDALVAATHVVEPVEEGSGQQSGKDQIATESRRRNPPKLQVERAGIDEDKHCAVFPTIAVIDQPDGREADSGQYVVVFSLPAPFTGQFHGGLRFFYSNERQVLEERRMEERQRAERRQQVTLSLTQAHVAARAARDALLQTTQAITSLENWRRDIAGREDSVLVELRAFRQTPDSQAINNIDLVALHHELRDWRIAASSPASIVPHPFLNLSLHLVASINSLAGRQTNLPPVLHKGDIDPLTLKANNTHLVRDPDGYYGKLVSFCTVESERLCRLLSHQFRNKFSHYLVRNKDCMAKRVIESNAARLKADPPVMYREGQSNEPLQPLPHKRLPETVQQSISGNPCYVFELLHFPEPDNHLRDVQKQAVLRAVGSTMLMNNMADIERYRQLLAHYKIFPVPTILSLHELKARNADNSERLGASAVAPPLTSLVPRVGVRTVGIERQITTLQQQLAKVEAITAETADIRQRWVANRWAEVKAQQEQTYAVLEQRRAQLESDLGAMADEVGQEAAVAVPGNVLLTSGAKRRRQPRGR